MFQSTETSSFLSFDIRSEAWKMERLLFVSLIAIYLLPIWAFPYFPTQDGPNHVDNAVAFYRYFRGEESFLREYYTLNLRLVPNWLTNAALATLTAIVPP